MGMQSLVGRKIASDQSVSAVTFWDASVMLPGESKHWPGLKEKNLSCQMHLYLLHKDIKLSGLNWGGFP